MNHPNDTATPVIPEFSRPVNVSDLATVDTVMPIEAKPHELSALAERLGVDGIEALKARAVLKILPNEDVLLEMSFSARVQQRCVVTLKPMVSDISASFTTTYSEEADENWGHDEEEFEDLDDAIEPPEPLIDGKIDLGEACVEQLALEIDPFPRVKGATFDGYSTDPRGADAGEFEKKNPFAVLSKLKTKQENDQ